MDQLFHGCAYMGVDGTHKLIGSGQDYILQTNKCFWKDPRDVNTSLKTRSVTTNKPSVHWTIIDNYYKDKEKDNAVI